MKLKIQELSDQNIQAWDAYVNEHQDGTVFHLSKWKKVIEKSFGHKSHYLIATSGDRSPVNDKNAIEGILPLFHLKSRMFGNYFVSIPFAEIGGAIADDDDVRKRLSAEACRIAEEAGCDYLELRNRRPVDNFKTKDLYFNFRREIFSDLDDNLMAIPRKARRMIRQGDKHGLTFEFGCHQIDTFYSIMCSSYRNLGTPIFSKRFFTNFLKAFDDHCQILMIRSKEGQPVAGVMSFFFKDQVLPYYAGSEFEFRRLAPNDFMYWQLMKYGCEKGYKLFDFGRSKVDTGSYHFKRHWGFKAEPLAYQYYLIRMNELPNLSPTNPRYKKKIEMWRNLPLWATRMIGPPIAKYLG